MKKGLLVTAGIVAVMAVIYYSGPAPGEPEYSKELPQVPAINEIEGYIRQNEAAFHLRPGNEAQIVWADSTGQTSEYVFLYLHGFSASQMEGDPLHRHIAGHYGANLYLARIAGHGLDTSLALAGFNPESAWESAKEALMISRRLGEKIIIMSTSTGSPLAFMLAAHYPDHVHALINLSPNIRIKNPAARILNDPWGREIAILILGKQRHIEHEQKEAELYWDTIHRIESLVSLEQLLETTMHDSLFARVQCPVLTLYYYRDDEHQDQVVDVSVIPGVHDALGTPDSLKKFVALATPGDHVIGSSIKSKDYFSVEKEIVKFCNTTLKMTPDAN